MSERGGRGRVGGDGGSNRLPVIATVEEIQRRLVRPSLPLPPPPLQSTDDRCYYPSSHPLGGDVKPSPHENQIRGDEEAERKLEDYLDPVLLAVISSRMWGKIDREEEEEEQGGVVKWKGGRRISGFEWPAEELEGFWDPDRGSEKRRRVWTDEAVDLNGDEETDVKEVLKEEEVEGDGAEDGACSPFRRFEETVVRLFNKAGAGYT